MINQSKQEQSFNLMDILFFILFLPLHLINFSIKFIYYYILFAFYGFIFLVIWMVFILI